MPTVEVLTDDELLALAGLLRVLVLADRAIDVYELDALERVGKHIARAPEDGAPYRTAVPPPMGPDAFRMVFAEASRRLPDDEAVRDAARAVERQAAREVIYTIVLDVAASNGIVPEEQAILDWLTDRWAIETRALNDGPPYR